MVSSWVQARPVSGSLQSQHCGIKNCSSYRKKSLETIFKFIEKLRSICQFCKIVFKILTMTNCHTVPYFRCAFAKIQDKWEVLVLAVEWKVSKRCTNEQTFRKYIQPPPRFRRSQLSTLRMFSLQPGAFSEACLPPIQLSEPETGYGLAQFLPKRASGVLRAWVPFRSRLHREKAFRLISNDHFSAYH